jgi:ubiquinone/menaquinone biosynthesis C-methylase UbiE/Pyruvate/2-oxoacid:ferredoxin oxidoreductase delta subunit
MDNLLNMLSCPECFLVTDNCNADLCKQECLRACIQKAIILKGRKAQIDSSRCNSCSFCAIKCPYNAIDKFPLEKVDDRHLYCASCSTSYPKHCNTYILLPKKNLREMNAESFFADYRAVLGDKWIDWKFSSYPYYVRYNKFVKYVNPIIKDDLVLDVGCASATLSYNFKNYIGLDSSVKLVSFAGSHIMNSILLADARYIPLRNNSIPFFVCRNLLEHTFQELQIISELRRVKIKGGFFELPCSDTISWVLDPINSALKNLGLKPLRAFTYGYGHVNMLTFPEWKEKIIQGGFKIVDTCDMEKGLVFNLQSFFEALVLSFRDNDFIPTFMMPKNIYEVLGKLFTFFDKVDPKITKAWSKLFYVR